MRLYKTVLVSYIVWRYLYENTLIYCIQCCAHTQLFTIQVQHQIIFLLQGLHHIVIVYEKTLV